MADEKKTEEKKSDWTDADSDNIAAGGGIR